MNRIIAAALVAGIAIGGATSANAADGCGPGGHRGPYGHCRPNGGRFVGGPPVLVVGNYYHGRGYWDGRRYYHYRERFHGGWRYR